MMWVRALGLIGRDDEIAELDGVPGRIRARRDGCSGVRPASENRR